MLKCQQLINFMLSRLGHLKVLLPRSRTGRMSKLRVFAGLTGHFVGFDHTLAHSRTHARTCARTHACVYVCSDENKVCLCFFSLKPVLRKLIFIFSVEISIKQIKFLAASLFNTINSSIIFIAVFLTIC